MYVFDSHLDLRGREAGVGFSHNELSHLDVFVRLVVELRGLWHSLLWCTVKCN